MDSLGHILNGKQFELPDEATAVRAYVARRYGATTSVKLQNNALILSVPNSALAATLYLERQQITEKCQLTRRLVIKTVRQ